uniref:Uncharacterized protein n=1 Tax=Meloidogyne enterolobii TaxID=390850 RepID=A0A6V7WFV4_MELEN|nr:unnamed protein product [Meloidogyne enterolobii]
MKILTSKLILPLLFLLVLDLKGLDAGNTCRKQNSAAGGSQRLNKGKKPMKAGEEIGEEILIKTRVVLRVERVRVTRFDRSGY